MGLDAVELVIEVEQAFSIKIPDDEAVRMLTPGDVHEYILANTKMANNSSVCLSAVAFYSLRRAAKSLGVRDRLRPRDSTTRMIPDSNVRGFWANLQNAAQLKLPRLRRPAWMVAASSGVAILSAACFGYAVYRSTDSEFAMVVSALTAVAVTGFLLGVITIPFAILPSKNVGTLRGLAEAVLGLNFQTLAERSNGAHSRDIWIALRAIIVEQLGVSPEMVTPSASFVNDLGCN
jgi:acyl carrier protein